MATDLAAQAAAEARRTAPMIAPDDPARWLPYITKSGTSTTVARLGPRQLWIYARPTSAGKLAFAVVTTCRQCAGKRVIKVETQRQAAQAADEANRLCPTCQAAVDEMRRCDRCDAPHAPADLVGGLCSRCRQRAADDLARVEREAARRAEEDARVAATYTAVRAALPDTSHCQECGKELDEFDRIAEVVPGLCFDCA